MSQPCESCGGTGTARDAYGRPTPDDCPDCGELTEQGEFWLPIIKPGGVWDYDAILTELADYRTLLAEVPLVYCHVTGGQISKPNTIASAVISEADAYYERWAKEAYAEGWQDAMNQSNVAAKEKSSDGREVSR